MATYQVKQIGSSHYVVDLPDEDLNALLVYRYDGGDIDTRMRNAEMMHRALYDLYQCRDGIREGDRFETEYGAFECVSFHVVPAASVDAAAKSKAALDLLIQADDDDRQALLDWQGDASDDGGLVRSH